MRFFPLVFTGITAGLHLYLFFNLRRTFGGGWWQVPAALVIGFGMYVVFCRGREAAEWVNQVTYLWLGLLILFGEFFLFREVLAMIGWIRDRFSSSGWYGFFTSPGAFRITLCLAVIGFAWALYEASHPIVRRVTIPTDRLPASEGSVRLVLLTDLHITPWTTAGTLQHIVEMTNGLQPDVLVIAGDFVDGQFPPEGWQAAQLARLRARYGKIAVLGNHELYSGREASIRFIRGGDLTLLRGEAVRAGPLVVAGVDDPQVGGRVEIIDALGEARDLDQDAFRLLVSHRPEVPEAARGMFDLALSGHTHGGQVWPIRYFAWYLNGFPQGLTAIPAPAGRDREESLLYISNGTRFWGPPVRFLTPAEITVLELVPESPSGEITTQPR